MGSRLPRASSTVWFMPQARIGSADFSGWTCIARSNHLSASSNRLVLSARSETASRCIDRALQIHGGLGMSREFPLERGWRDARIAEIFEGTNEIQRIVIAGELLQEKGVRIRP